jgi:hypothetical protein
MLLNLSNHPSAKWTGTQIGEAYLIYLNIEDLPFPQIPPTMNSTELDLLVEEYEAKIRKADPAAIHIMGELTFTFRLVTRLKEIGYRCIASTTERVVTEDGNGTKTSTFTFVQFRDY